MVGLLLLEIRSLKFFAQDFLQEQKTQNDRFDAIASALTTQTNSLATQMTNSQQQFAATMATMGHLTSLQKEQLDDAIGGNSFPLVEVIGFSDGAIKSDGSMSVTFGVFGLHPMYNIDGQFGDLAEMERIHAAQGYGFDTLYAGETPITFPYMKNGMGVILSSFKLHWAPNETLKRYNISVIAKNGMFMQLLRVKRTGARTVLWATRVSAQYYDGRQGLVYEQIQNGFPKDLLASEGDWKLMNGMKRIQVKWEQGFVQFSQ